VPLSALFAACNAFDVPAGPLAFGGPNFTEIGSAGSGLVLGQPGFETGGSPAFSDAGATSIGGVGGTGVDDTGVGGTGPGLEAPVGGSGVVPPDASVPEDAGARDDAGVDAGP
jgi:hypothetical protein